MKYLCWFSLLLFCLSSCRSGFDTSSKYTGSSRDNLQLVNRQTHDCSAELDSSKPTETHEVKEDHFISSSILVSDHRPFSVVEITDYLQAIEASPLESTDGPEKSMGLNEDEKESRAPLSSHQTNQYDMPQRDPIQRENAEQKTDGFAIAALIATLAMILAFGLTSPLAIIFGIIGLRRINKSEGALKGEKMARGGIVWGSIVLAAQIILIMIFWGGPT